MSDNGYTDEGKDQVFDITKYTGKWRVLGEENGKVAPKIIQQQQVVEKK